MIHHFIDQFFDQYGMQLGAFIVIVTIVFVAKFDTKLRPAPKPRKRLRTPWFNLP